MTGTLLFNNAVYQLKNGTAEIGSLALREHDLCVLTGRNGCGKSTIAGAAAGKFPLIGGTAPRELKTALVSFEDQQKLFEDDFNLRNTDTASSKEELGITPSDLIDAGPFTQRIIETFELESLMTRPIRTLSGGEGRKVLIAKALNENPGLLILDAPFDSLDSATRKTLLQIIHYIHKNFTTPMILVVNRRDEIPEDTTCIGLVEDLKLKEVTAFDRTQELKIAAILNSTTTAAAELPKAPEKFASKKVAGEVLVSLKNINITYDRPVFKNFNFTLRKGQHYLITGPNGAGKSTLLSLITGDNPLVYTNDVTVFGMKRGSGESIWDIKQYFGCVSSALHLDYRVSSPLIEVILSGFYDSIGLYSTPGDEELSAAKQWLKLIELDHVAQKSFKALSFGQQRLALIVRAMVKNPPLLILDEPLQGLDAAARSQVKAFVSTIIRQGDTSVLFVSHHEEDYPEGITDTLTFTPDGKGGFDIVHKTL